MPRPQCLHMPPLIARPLRLKAPGLSRRRKIAQLRHSLSRERVASSNPPVLRFTRWQAGRQRVEEACRLRIGTPRRPAAPGNSAAPGQPPPLPPFWPSRHAPCAGKRRPNLDAGHDASAASREPCGTTGRPHGFDSAWSAPRRRERKSSQTPEKYSRTFSRPAPRTSAPAWPQTAGEEGSISLSLRSCTAASA
jgi:hypothetical protein